VSLHRNSQPALRAAAMLRTAVMRGLRAFVSRQFWFRHAGCACFTSRRDVSLHRNSQPALRAAAMLRTAVMRGLRA
jgi:hypothetical protein